MSHFWTVFIGFLAPLLFVAPPAASPSAPVPDAPARAAFTVEFGDVTVPYREMAVTAMPGETTAIAVPAASHRERYRVTAQAGTIARHDAGWTWTAPHTPGLYPITVTDPASRATITLNAFVLTPFDPDQNYLKGYRIGPYESTPLDGRAAYRPPRGFIELTDATANVRVSPHFTLGQFRCKQTGGPPAYVLLRAPLLLKLELILETLHARGLTDAPTLHVMSGFRTPYYNRAIGNTTSYSRHLYGGAADIFVDADGDGRMDDLNGDGRSTEADARVLARLIDDLMEGPRRRHMHGGLSTYGANAAHGPFVHVDVRGTRARW